MRTLLFSSLAAVFLCFTVARPPQATAPRTIHVVVALCDNVNQGIVKVPKRIGNGQDPANNLYWGCGYGIKTFFSRSAEWVLVKKISKPETDILERLLFRHKSSGTYMLADAYDGAKIKNATISFLKYSSGSDVLKIAVNDTLSVNFGGSSDLTAYIGHNGLMDFELQRIYKSQGTKKREAVILACASRPYFTDFLRDAGSYPMLWTTNLMCPEAYTLDAAVTAWISKKSYREIHEKAAQAYNQYQKCGISGARNLLATGW